MQRSKTAALFLQDEHKKLCVYEEIGKISLNYHQISTNLFLWQIANEPPHDKTKKMTCTPSENSDQPGHPPSLIRVFAVNIKEAWV